MKNALGTQKVFYELDTRADGIRANPGCDILFIVLLDQYHSRVIEKENTEVQNERIFKR